MTNGDASTSYTGADPHAVHGLVTQERALKLSSMAEKS